MRYLFIAEWEHWDGVEIPSGLEELYCAISELRWTTFPTGLKKLTFSPDYGDTAQFTFPEPLKELNFERLDLDDSYQDFLQILPLPSGLERLLLKFLHLLSLVNIQFPENLRVLDLYHGHLLSLEGARFPDLLKELYAKINPIHSLKGVNFPDLIVLDLTGCPLRTLKDVKLPSLPEVLNLNGTDVMDLEDVILPN